MKVDAYIPHLNPLKFHVYGGLTTRTEGFFTDLIPDFEEETYYTQKFKSTDTLRLQFAYYITDDTGSYPTNVVSIIDKNGTVVLTPTVYGADSGNNSDVLTFRRISQILTGLSGIYYVIITITDDEETKEFVSEPIEIGAHENTVLIKYNNSVPDFDINFNDAYSVFQLRVEAGFWSDGYNVGNSEKIYFDQTHNPVLLSAIPFETEKITFGDNNGIPNWLADKLNRIFSCDTILVDGVYMCKNDGAKMEAVRERGIATAVWTLELVKTVNDYSLSDEILLERIRAFSKSFNQSFK